MTDPVLRPARPEDSDEVIRLVRLMYESMGASAGSEWESAARAVLAGPVSPARRILVVPGPGGVLAATGAGSIATRLPTPGNPAALVGYVQWISTDPARRSRGLARAVMTGLMSWYEGEGVRNVELHATPMGEPLYRSMDFVEPPARAMRCRW